MDVPNFQFQVLYEQQDHEAFKYNYIRNWAKHNDKILYPKYQTF